MADVLTDEQAKQVDAYGLEMLRNGVKCGVKTDRKKAKVAVDVLYRKHLEMDPPKQIKFVDSPEAAIKLVAKANKVEPKTLVNDLIFINLWTWWVAYYSAGINILGETKDVEKDLIDDLAEYEAITKTLHAILPCENVCFVIEYPKIVAIKDDDLEKFVLHRENGLALEYLDGTGFAWLNNVEVPDWVATTPASKLSVKKLLAETNVDIRREGLSRVPFAKIVKDTKAKLLDKLKDLKRGRWCDYALYDVKLGDNKTRRLLRMYDVASKKYPFERVEDDCETVLQALAMRDGEEAYSFPIDRT
jgi:hypothetical protein